MVFPLAMCLNNSGDTVLSARWLLAESFLCALAIDLKRQNESALITLYLLSPSSASPTIYTRLIVITFTSYFHFARSLELNLWQTCGALNSARSLKGSMCVEATQTSPRGPCTGPGRCYVFREGTMGMQVTRDHSQPDTTITGPAGRQRAKAFLSPPNMAFTPLLQDTPEL